MRRRLRPCHPFRWRSERGGVDVRPTTSTVFGTWVKPTTASEALGGGGQWEQGLALTIPALLSDALDAEQASVVGFGYLRRRAGKIAEREGNIIVAESRQRESLVEHCLQFPPTKEAIRGAGRQESPRGKERTPHRETRAVSIILRHRKNAHMPLAAHLELSVTGNEVAAISGEDDPATYGSEAQLRLIGGCLRALSLGSLNSIPAPGEGGDHTVRHALVKVQNPLGHHREH